MIVMGIDLGMTTKNPPALAIISAGEQADRPTLTASAGFVCDDRLPWYERIRQLEPALFDYAVRHGVDLIAWEMPHAGKNMQVAIKLAHVGGLALALAGRLGVPAMEVQPSEAKKALTGKGGASKQDMMDVVRERFGAELPKDEADAVGVAWAGLCLYVAELQKQAARRNTRRSAQHRV